MLNYTMPNTPVRTITAKAELYNSSAELLSSFLHTNELKSFDLERVGEESKFFGFGVCQKANIKLMDMGRSINNISTANYFKIYVNDYSLYPQLYVTEVNRDENTNELSITMYDKIYKAADHTVSEIELASYTLREFAEALASVLGISAVEATDEAFNLSFPNGANFDGAETFREALDGIAEATQTIYYINSEDKLVFKKLDLAGEAVLTITREDYITLDSKTNRKLTSIVSATELGDNVEASTGATGTTQYVRDNPFWELREDIAELVEAAIARVGGLTINQFSCSWRGNFNLEICDKINLITKDGGKVTSYVINDTISYNGAFGENTSWKYETNEGESENNPSNLGEALKQTYAKVDKANKEITLVASETSANASAISSLQLDTDSINLAVQSVEKALEENSENVNNQINTLTAKVEQTITPEELNIAIRQEIDNGVDKVKTSTGYSFNADGLNISKSGREMETKITENGMTVYRSGEAVLEANNEGVKAEDLHATTYLIIGTNSRFEDYSTGRTGCFWIGG